MLVEEMRMCLQQHETEIANLQTALTISSNNNGNINGTVDRSSKTSTTHAMSAHSMNKKGITFIVACVSSPVHLLITFFLT